MSWLIHWSGKGDQVTFGGQLVSLPGGSAAQGARMRYGMMIKPQKTP
jgi:hypothetical protein